MDVDDLDVCGIYNMEFDRLQADLCRLQSETNDLDHRLSTPRQSGHHRHTVFLQPQHPGDHRGVSRVQSVTFDDCVTVHAADDDDRKSPWLRMAGDRMRFRRRIKQIELILGPVLTEEHRMIVRLHMMSFDLSIDV